MNYICLCFKLSTVIWPIYLHLQNYKATNSAASSPKQIANGILDNIGFKNLGLNKLTYASSAIWAIVSFSITTGVITLAKNSTLAIAIPSQAIL